MRIFSAIQPTGKVHIGNYLGTIVDWIELQNNANQCIFSVVDQHAITVIENCNQLSQNTYNTLAILLASGIDINKSTLFVQSSIAVITQMSWLLSCFAQYGWLNRMTQFKSKQQDCSSVGLYIYPILMAADILSCHASHVPVGHDQKQHLELTRDIAIKFNNYFKCDFFPIPKPIIKQTGSRIMSLTNGQVKMSKSDPANNSCIFLLDSEQEIIKKIRKAKTDTEPIPDNIAQLDTRPEAKNLLTIYATISKTTLDETIIKFSGQNFKQLKNEITELIINIIKPISHEANKILTDRVYLDDIINQGKNKIQNICQPILAEMYKIIGLRQ